MDDGKKLKVCGLDARFEDRPKWKIGRQLILK